MYLLLGATGVGKTLLLRKIKNFYTKDESEKSMSTIPTVGTNIVKVSVDKKREGSVREVGGAMGPIWFKYYSECHAVMFVIDVANPCQVSSSCIQLLTVLSHKELQQKPFIIIFNRSDIPSQVKPCNIKQLMRLDDVIQAAKQPIKVVDVSARQEENLTEIMQWMITRWEKITC
ncbi:ADP-ribosylation factor-like protein 16 [Anneissia japonica]|uniref:ADP-ribosylation factor-like protein 16 n=1 Tax=Anneissia japonica TaxID=1529436 RepID=UPI001425A438|nr:ADP-ribosylation factor-like protein 16 [Anneissia japonica]